MTYSNTVKKANEQLHKEMDTLLNKCTEVQQNFFRRMYPAGVPDKKLDWALSQIERTLNKEK